MNIYIGEPKTITISDMQWPCPDWFHVPLSSEWQAIVDAWVSLWAWTTWSNWHINFSTYLKIPLAWFIEWDTSNYEYKDSIWSYWSSTSISSWEWAYYLLFRSLFIRPQESTFDTYWMSIRWLKNTPVIPDSSWATLYQWTWSAGILYKSDLWLISISSDGSTWYTIQDKNLWATTTYNYWDTLSESNCGYYYQWGNNNWFPFNWTLTTSTTQVNANTYWPWNYYESSTFVKRSGSPYCWDSSKNKNKWWWVSQWTSTKTVPQELQNIYIGEYKPINTAGIYHNSTLWLISLSSDWTNWITIADKNLWATQVYENQSDTRTLANCGNYYQWWNNYWFWYGIAFPNTSYTQVDATWYWPWNYYNSDTYVSSSSWWLTGYFPNLWWNSTNTNASRQWPCDTWWHVPSQSEMENWVSLWMTITWNWSSAWATFLQHFFIPLMWYRTIQWYYQLWSVAFLYNTHWINKQSYYLYVSNSNIITSGSANNAYAKPIRPFKNEAVQPTSSWDIIYQPS